LFGLIVLIFGLVWYFDPEARGPRDRSTRRVRRSGRSVRTMFRAWWVGPRQLPFRRVTTI